MSDYEKKIENFHLKFYGKIDNQKFIENLHQRVYWNKVNRYSKILILSFILFFVIIKTNDYKNLENFSEMNFHHELPIKGFQDSIYTDSLYFLEIQETFFTMGDIWSILEFLDEIELEQEYRYENYN